MTAGVFSQIKWESALLAEAKRDVVFIFNIASGAFSGPKPAPAQEELPTLLERVADYLLEAGCAVGYLAVGTDEPALPAKLMVPREHLAKGIACFYAEDPEAAKFLAFVHPARSESSLMPNPSFKRTPDGAA